MIKNMNKSVAIHVLICNYSPIDCAVADKYLHQLLSRGFTSRPFSDDLDKEFIMEALNQNPVTEAVQAVTQEMSTGYVLAKRAADIDLSELVVDQSSTAFLTLARNIVIPAPGRCVSHLKVFA